MAAHDIDLTRGLPRIHFAAGGQSVTITLQEPYDSMWDERHVTVVARSGAFHGSLDTLGWTYELYALHQLLIDLDRTVGRPDRKEWHAMEDELVLRFELTRLGHVQVQVQLRDRSANWPAETFVLPAETLLTFTLQADQTYLPLWIQEVGQALDALTP